MGGFVRDPSATVAIDAPSLRAGTLSGISVHAEGSYGSALVNVARLSASWRGQTLMASGSLGLGGKDQSLNLQAQSSQVSIAHVLAGLNLSTINVGGTTSLRADVTGTVRNPEARVHLTGSNLTAFGETLGEVEIRAGMSGRVARVEELKLEKPQENGNGLLRASGTYNLDTRAGALELTSKGVSFTRLTLPDGSAVRAHGITAEAKGSGSVDDPALKLTVNADSVAYRGQELGRIEGTVDVVARQADIRLNAPKYSLAGSARVGTQAPYAGTFELAARDTQVQNLPLPADLKLSGTLTAAVKGTGTVEDYSRGQASIEVEAANLDWRGQPVRNSGPIRATYSGEVLTIDQATVIARDSQMSLQGKLPLTAAAGTGEVRLEAKLDLATLASYLPPQQSLTAVGTATIEGPIRGTLRRIDPELKIALREGSFFTPEMKAPLTNAELDGDVRNGALELHSVTAKLGTASVTASGVVPFEHLPELPVDLPRRRGAAQFQADLKSLDLGALGLLPGGVAGTLSATLEASAPRADIKALSATLTLPEFRLAVQNYAVEQKGTSRISVLNGVATVGEFALTGPLTDLRLTGTAGLTGQYPLDLQLTGTTDASLASAFVEEVSARGAIAVQAAVTGAAREPLLKGFFELSDGQLSLKNPLVAAEGVNARLELNGKQFVLTKLDGSINGGTLSGSGTFGYAGGRLLNTDLTVRAGDVYFDFPAGLKTLSNVDLRLRSTASGSVLGGQVSIQEGGFSDDLNLDTGILAALTAPASIELTKERDPFLESLRFNVGIRTVNPLVVDNNLARAEVSADLRVVGTPYETGLAGRLEIEQDGEIRLQERQYVVERGIITFNNERRIEPELNVIATTSVAGYDVRLQVQGPPGKTETVMTANPSLPEPDILALLITGKTVDQMQGQEFTVAREQVLSYLAGRVGTTLGRGIQSATGLSTVRLEPNLIAAEADPSARLTVGQNITRQLELIYSMDLVNSSDQIYVAEYDLTRRFVTRGVRQSDGSFRMDFRHDLHFGGLAEPRRSGTRLQRRIGEVALAGNPFFGEERILDRLKLKPGGKYDFFKTRQGVDRVTKLYMDEGLLEAKVRMRRETRDEKVDLKLYLERGPKVEFVFEGISIPDAVRKRVRDLWQSGVFDTQRAEDARTTIRDWLARENYLRPVIDHSISATAAESKRVLFDINPGPRFQDVTLEFEGAAGQSPSQLRSVIDKQKLDIDVYAKPARVTAMLTRYYHEMGYLDAEVSTPRYELDAQTRTGRVVFPVQEGPLYRVGAVTFEGNQAISAGRLAEAVPMPAGEAYRPVLRENALGRLKAAYWQEGYNDIEAQFLTRRNAADGVVDVIFRIEEGPRSLVREILVEGRDKTSDNLIRSQLAIHAGEPLSLEKVSLSRRHLYDTGAYSLVDIVNEPVDDGLSSADTKSMRLRVRVREIQPYEFRYGAFFDTENGPGIIADLSNRNTLGSARVLGVRGRYDSQLREARLYFSQPILRRFPLKSIASPYWRQERNPATSDTDAFNVDRIGFSVQQEARIRQQYLINYGYRIESSRTYDPGPDAFFDVPLRIASLTSAFSRETRDEIMDATRGDFMSHAIQFSPVRLGSELSFLKYSGQYFRYFPLQKPRIELFTNEVKRPRLVYATAVRVGLSKGFGGQEVPLSERFFAGGATTLRGFEQNTAGPIAGRQPLGGQGMFVLNNELRVPLFSIFDAVGFSDVGNVFGKVSDFSLADLRKTAGIGLRVRTPWFLLRLDYGFKLDRREGEQAGRLFFSIGQAF
ncbi:MAG: translocation/assembly module TamB domain-containing protein [Bryobacterales bacterium]|nr:translocation/assembly module TamB domain-containing protein [Bryobacterales bacterium]